MTRLDDDLVRAARELAEEPLPSGMLDDELAPPSAGRRWVTVVAAVAGMVLVAAAVGLGIDRLPIGPSPSATAEPTAEISATAEASPMGVCEDLLTPSGGADVVLVRFPCGPTGALTAGVRSVALDLAPVARLHAAIGAVLDGPSELELSVGFSPVVPTGSADLLDGVKLSDDGLATIGFTDELLRINNLSASAASAAFLGALRETAFQFDEVTAIEFTASGSCEAFFEFLQSTCEHIARPVDGVFGACRIIPPVELPSGAPPTVPRAYPGQPIVSWGSGEDSVRQRADEGSTSMPDGATAVEVRGYPGWIVPTGDEPLPQPFDIAWIEDGCTYAVTVAPRDGVSAAIEYAGRIGPSVAQPTPPPAEPVTVSVEEQGVRLTATVDRDRTVFGQRVIASVEILNLGPGPVFWGHSSTCPFPAHVQVHQDDARPLDPGRTDWTGDDAVLKSVTVDDVTPASAGLFEFRPESWLDFDGLMACTSDFVTSEIAEGAALTHVAAWDSEAQQGMPPPPGTYVVEATFSFLSRGAPPAFDDVSEPMHVTVPLPLTVEGPDVAYLSPGQAFDAVLADDRYRAFLADAPRTRWRQSDLAYDDGRWIATLYLSTSSRESDEVEAIVAVVDARSGEVLSVTLEERPMPAGG